MNAATDLPALMALRVRGRAEAAQLARATACTEQEAGATLARLVAAGLVTTAAHGGLALSHAGREALVRLIAAEPIDRVALAAEYERFAVVDRELKRTITAWQLADAPAQRAARDDLRHVADAAQARARALGDLAARFAPYAARIAAAAAAVAGGDSRFVASPHVDSLHQVWFELHQDMLLTLGRSREA